VPTANPTATDREGIFNVAGSTNEVEAQQQITGDDIFLEEGEFEILNRLP
jgi:hypothetical protein